MKKTHIIGLLFIVVAIGAIISLVYNADTYASFAEARSHPGREFHIIGELNRDKAVEERVEDNTLILTFHMIDQEGEEAEVLYFGAKPQDFEQSDEVVLIGKYESERFVAGSLLLKCPSKYKPGEIGQTEYSYD
jgi:cytochrome c-type biogenesis protein CcmE